MTHLYTSNYMKQQYTLNGILLFDRRHHHHHHHKQACASEIRITQ